MEEKILQMIADVCDDDIVFENRDVVLDEEGIMDSLDFIMIISEIEERFGVVISPTEIDKEMMNTPAKIIKLIMERI